MSMTMTKVAPTTSTVGTVYKMFNKGLMRDDHPQQRHGNRHSTNQTCSFIATVIKNEDFDPIKLCEQQLEDGVVNWLIDGKQRLTEIADYKNNVFKLNNSVELPIVEYQTVKDGKTVTVEYDLRGKYYNDLPEELQMQFDDCPIRVIKHLNCTNEEVGYHIRRYNNVKPMTASESVITYTDNAAKYIKEITNNHRFFKDCGNYTETQRNNGSLDRVVIDSYMVLYHLNDWKKKSDAVGKFLDKNATEERFNEISDMLDKLYPICDNNLHTLEFDVKNTFIFLPVFKSFLDLGLDISEFDRFLCALEEDLINKQVVIDNETTSFYELNYNGKSTKDKAPISQKIELLTQLMNEFFGMSEVSEDELAEFEEEVEATDEEIVADIVGVKVEDINDDYDFYTELTDGYLNDCVKDGSKLKEIQNHLAMVAMTIYSEVQAKAGLDDWLEDYAKRVNTYNSDTVTEFNAMKVDFQKYMAKHNVA